MEKERTVCAHCGKWTSKVAAQLIFKDHTDLLCPYCTDVLVRRIKRRIRMRKEVSKGGNGNGGKGDYKGPCPF